MPSEHWTCPHCFTVLDWEHRSAIENHNCEAIQELIGAARTRVARLDSVIRILKNPNPKRKESIVGKTFVPTTVPGKPIRSSAVLQLRGTSGSGKTTAMRALFELLDAQPFQQDAKGHKVRAYLGVLNVHENPVQIFILGDYSPERSAGGCDTIPTVQETIDLIEEYGSRKNSLVVFEGLLLAHSWGAVGSYVHPRWGERYINAFLDTPVEKCIERVTKRRADKGRETEGDRAAKIEKNIRDDYYRVELCYKRVVDRGGVRVDINHRRAKAEFVQLVVDTAERYCV